MNIELLLQQLTPEEKMAMIHAAGSFKNGEVKRLGIRSLIMSDGPHGVREDMDDTFEPLHKKDDYSIYLPTGICLAATWNRRLGYAFGEVLGKEAKARGKDIILGPGINIIRTPLCGRNFEYLSEDPFLISEMVVDYIKGVQAQGIAACVKHFAANNQEFGRLWINVEMSDRALHEIYLPGFKAAVEKGEVLTIMGAYNRFRGVYCSQHHFLLNQILKDDWNFKGMVISDWGAVNDYKQAALGGVDLEMGTELFQPRVQHFNDYHMAKPLLDAVTSGEINEKIIDEKIRRLVYVMNKIKPSGKKEISASELEEHHETAKDIAAEGIVLLKNEEKLLPLKTNEIKRITVIGHNATFRHAHTGGSSMVKARYEITPLEGIQKFLGDKTKIDYAQGYEIGKDIDPDKKECLIGEAVDKAKSSDVVLLFGGLIHSIDDHDWENTFDCEHKDKESIILPFYQDELIERVTDANKNTVLVLFGGGAVDMRKWIDKIAALLYVWYPGMEGGNAIAGIVTGMVNPSGKLPVTFPRKLEDSPAHNLGEYPGNKEGTVVYHDDIYVGYRYFDTFDVNPLFCFGHGLSYTTFRYSDLKLSDPVMKINDALEVYCNITNTGTHAGKEIVQLYISDEHSPVKRPRKELKGFEKIHLKPGEQKEIRFIILPEHLSFYDEHQKQWKAEPGKFKIMIGSSSADIRLTGNFILQQA